MCHISLPILLDVRCFPCFPHLLILSHLFYYALQQLKGAHTHTHTLLVNIICVIVWVEATLSAWHQWNKAVEDRQPSSVSQVFHTALFSLHSFFSNYFFLGPHFFVCPHVYVHNGSKSGVSVCSCLPRPLLCVPLPTIVGIALPSIHGSSRRMLHKRMEWELVCVCMCVCLIICLFWAGIFGKIKIYINIYNRNIYK